MIRFVGILLVIIVFLSNARAQSATLKFDSLVSVAQLAMAQEDVPRAEFYINLLKAHGEVKNATETINLLTTEKLILQTDYPQALGYIEKLKQSERTSTIIHSLILEGKILNRQGQFKKSITILESVGNKLDNTESGVRGERWHWLGASLMETGKNKEAQECFLQALSIFQSDSSKFYVKLALSRIMAGINFKRTGNYQAAEREYQLAIKILENTPLPKYRERSRAYINLANVYNEQRNYLLAQQYYLKSLDLYQTKLRDSSQLTILYNNMAQFYQSYGNGLASKEYFDKWYQLFSKTSKQNYNASALKMLVNYGAFLGDVLFEFDHADEILRKAEGYLNEDSNPEDHLLLIIARVQNFIGPSKNDSTSVQLEKARSILLEYPETQYWFDLYCIESTLATNTKRYEKADSLIQLALVAAKTYEDSSSRLADAYRLWGLNLDLQQRHPEAAEKFKEALKMMDAVSNPYHPNRIALLNHTGISYFNNKQVDSARHYLVRALQANQLPVQNNISRFSDPFEVLVSNFYLIQLTLKEDPTRLKDAEVYVLTSYSIIEDKRQSLKSSEDQRLYNRAVRDFFDIAITYYFRMFTLTQNGNYFNRAFEFAEKSRYQALQHSLQDVRIGEFASVTQRIVSQEQELQKQINLLTKQIVEAVGSGEPTNPDLLREYNTGLVTLETRHHQMLDSVKKNLPGIYNLKFSTTTVSPSALQKDLLKSDMAFVQYHVGYEKVFVLIVTKEKPYMVELQDKMQLLKNIRQLSTINRLRLSREFIPAAHQLYKLLLQPVDSVLAHHRIKINHYVLIPDGEINYVPFDVLITKPAPELNACKFLLNEKILSYGYSSTLLWQEFSDYSLELQNAKMLSYAPTFNRQTEVELNETGLRNTAYKSQYATFDFQPLQNNTQEVKSISKIVKQKGYQDETLFAEQADEASFKRKDLNDYQIIHLATHGFVDYPTNQSSGIAFSYNETSGEDGILFMDEIFSLRSRAHLVCLSACQTGFGKVDVGEGMMSMTRAFLYSGVKNLVVSLWSVQDNSTAMLMENFYKQFVKSKSISLSLRSAKLQMMKEKEFSHPYNWAGFIHVGLN